MSTSLTHPKHSDVSSRRFDALVFIGRFQPIHRGHVEVLGKALALADTVCVLIGSADRPRTIKDPFTFDERRVMVESSIDAADRGPSRRRKPPLRCGTSARAGRRSRLT